MDITNRLDRMEKMLSNMQYILTRMAYPATTLSLHEKATEIRKALDSGDRKVLRQTMKDINGE